MQGFKGFDKDLKCRGFQYEIGGEYSIEGALEICENGFHFCDNPFNVFDYYPPTIGTRYCIVEAIGTVIKHEDGDKCVTDKIKIIREITLSELYRDGFNLLKSHSQTTGNYAHSQTTGYYAHSQTTGNEAHSQTTGNYAHSQTTGNYAHSQTTGNEAHSQTTGDYAHSQTTGDYAHSQTTGDEAIACSLGVRAKAKAVNGWIVIVDWRYDNEWKIEAIHSAKVGGMIGDTEIKPDVWYWFEDGKLMQE